MISLDLFKEKIMFVAVGTRNEIGDIVYEDMLKLRHKIFHERLQWDIPSTAKSSDMEEDVFDTKQTVYVVIGDPVVACCRLIPTTRMTMISALWPDVMDSVQPHHATWELSRFAADRDAHQPGLLAARLLFEAYKFALEREIERYIVISTPAAAKVIRRMGIRTSPIPSVDKSIVASSTEITPEVGGILDFLIKTHEKMTVAGVHPLAMLTQSRSGSSVRL